MGFPDAMNPAHYKGDNACAKLKELNADAKTYSEDMNAPEQLIQNAIKKVKDNDYLYVFVPSMLLPSFPGRLGKVMSIINRANWTVAAREDGPNNVGSVFVLKPIDSNKDVCNTNFVEALLAINKALTGESTVTMLLKYKVDFINLVSKNPANALLLGEKMQNIFA